MRFGVMLCAAAILFPACYGSDPNLTESGEGKPVVSVDFPPSVEAGSRATASFEIENPGPGDMEAVELTFAVLGTSDLPAALVGFGVRGENPSVIEVDPEPVAVSEDAVRYNFGALEEGDSMAVDFTLRMPSQPGSYANSVTAADGTDLDRARGVRLETEVER